MIRHVPHGARARFLPYVWGARRDDYGWDGVDGEREVGAFRAAASGMAALLISPIMPIWRELLPGSMKAVMGTRSELYLADYWVLTLHHLVWSKRLPYPIRARWAQGSSVHDESFYFVSELPVDLIEASEDALILFQEAAMRALLERHALKEDGDEPRHNGLPLEPPLYRDGRWRLPSFGEAAPREQDGPAGVERAGEDTTEDGKDDVSPETAPLELDDQSFTVRFGGASYRFAGRNKQLFALLERISRRPGFRVSFDDLRSKGDVWDGAFVEDSTIRGAVARLRKTLKDHGLAQLAERIATGSYHGKSYAVLDSEAPGDPR